MALLGADAELSLVSDGGGTVGSAIIFDEVNSGTQAYVDHYSIWKQTSSVGSSLVGYYGTSPGPGGNKIFEFGSAGRFWVAGLSGNATFATMRYDTITDEVFYNTSSSRYKTNIDYTSNEILNRAKNLILNAKVCFFDMKDGSALRKLGMIAEDMAELDFRICYYNKDNKVEGYNNEDIVPHVVRVVQEHNKDINTLRHDLDSLISRVNILEN